jgi:hypothetical protein
MEPWGGADPDVIGKDPNGSGRDPGVMGGRPKFERVSNVRGEEIQGQGGRNLSVREKGSTCGREGSICGREGSICGREGSICEGEVSKLKKRGY